MPYKVECTWLGGGFVTFGFGFDDAVVVHVFGFGKNDPPLGFARLSVAAKDLSRRLCDRIEGKMADLLRDVVSENPNK
jgi:hypothetical protein